MTAHDGQGYKFSFMSTQNGAGYCYSSSRATAACSQSSQICIKIKRHVSSPLAMSWSMPFTAGWVPGYSKALSKVTDHGPPWVCVKAAFSSRSLTAWIFATIRLKTKHLFRDFHSSILKGFTRISDKNWLCFTTEGNWGTTEIDFYFFFPPKNGFFFECPNVFVPGLTYWKDWVLELVVFPWTILPSQQAFSISENVTKAWRLTLQAKYPDLKNTFEYLVLCL